MDLILVDTSVWVDHIRRSNAELTGLISAGRCVLHPFVLGEIALGNLPDWDRQIARLHALPSIKPVDDDLLVQLVARFSLQGSGLGLVDAHLLASAQVAAQKLWSLDKRLDRQAGLLGLAWSAGRD